MKLAYCSSMLQKNVLLALKFGPNVVVVIIYLSSPRTKQTTRNWSNDRRFRRKFYIIFRVLFLPFSTYNPINFIDFASEWSNSQCIKSCDRLQILVGIDGVCSELPTWLIGRFWSIFYLNLVNQISILILNASVIVRLAFSMESSHI